MNSGEKKYGLILPQKNSNKINLAPKASIFSNNDSDNDEFIAPKNVFKKHQITTEQKYLKKQVQIDIEKALSEDPTCFEYDNVYDNFIAKKEKTIEKKKSSENLKPKYIESLLKAANQRKKEYERRVERQVQKEREAEKGKFDDKDKFVTNAYKEKMKRIQEEEEEERRQQAIEDMEDVTKTKDFSSFYKYLLDQKAGLRGPQEAALDSKKIETEDSKELIKIKEEEKTLENSLKREGSEKKNVGNKKIKTEVCEELAGDSDDSLASSSETEEEEVVKLKQNSKEIEEEKKNEENKKKEEDKKKEEEKKKKEAQHHKHTVGDALSDARARYLARKKSSATKPEISQNN